MIQHGDTRYFIENGKPLPWDRVRCFVVNPRWFLAMMNRTMTLSGLPPDAEYVRSWHDHSTDTFYVVVRSETFEECPNGVCPCTEALTVQEVVPDVTR